MPLTHRVLVGGRYTYDFNRSNVYALRTLGPGAERSILEGMISKGRNVRLFLTKNDVLSGVKYWLDDVPSRTELRALGNRLFVMSIHVVSLRAGAQQAKCHAGRFRSVEAARRLFATLCPPARQPGVD